MSQEMIVSEDEKVKQLKAEAATVGERLPEWTKFDAWVYLDVHLQACEDDYRLTVTTLETWIDFYRKYAEVSHVPKSL